MSASLVGSEMCIRDRRCPAGPAGPGGARKGPADPRGTRWMHFVSKYKCCLLYTSDAADDM
eukprot:14502658-Alexandrium_andersonii.AAC.1